MFRGPGFPVSRRAAVDRHRAGKLPTLLFVVLVLRRNSALRISFASKEQTGIGDQDKTTARHRFRMTKQSPHPLCPEHPQDVADCPA